MLGKRNDGYHELESLFYFPEIYDEIEITEKVSAEKLKFTGKFGRQLQNGTDDNIILKACNILKDRFPERIPELGFILTKNIPVSSGIGGGSANAAAVLRELNGIYALGLSNAELYKAGVKLGADVPPCVYSKPCFVQGIGEIITPVEMPKLHVLLVNPLIEVSTAEIFRMGFDEVTDIRFEVSGFRRMQSLIDFLETTRNDLEKNAKQICPQINNVLEAIEKQPGCLLSRMSGSGATCFGLFETRDKALMAKGTILKNKPDWWVEAGR